MQFRLDYHVYDRYAPSYGRQTYSWLTDIEAVAKRAMSDDPEQIASIRGMRVDVAEAERLREDPQTALCMMTKSDLELVGLYARFTSEEILFLDYVQVSEQHRGHDYGLVIAARFITEFGRRGQQVTLVAPCTALARYWKRLGFELIAPGVELMEMQLDDDRWAELSAVARGQVPTPVI